MLDNINCILHVYNPLTEIPPEEPDVEPDEEDVFKDEEEMLLDEMLRARMTHK